MLMWFCSKRFLVITILLRLLGYVWLDFPTCIDRAGLTRAL